MYQSVAELHEFNKHHAYVGASQTDLETVNRLIAILEGKRQGDPVPQDGDILLCVLPDGATYAVAHLEDGYEESLLTACVRPYAPPFIYEETGCNSSGGPWFAPSVNELEYIGKQVKTFKTWGWMGPRADGAVHFQAEVNVWKITDKKSRFV